MNERWLRIINELSICGKMTLVADKLNISQPAISKAVREMEEYFGVRLFDRIGKRMVPTYAGEVYQGYVQRILNQYAESREAIQDILAMKCGSIKLGASTTSGIYVLPDIVGQLVKLYPGIDVSIIIENTSQIAELIINNAVDFAFVEGSIHKKNIVIDEFCKDNLTMIVPSGHAWAKAGFIDPKRLIEEKLIMRESGSGTREVFENVLNANQIPYNVTFELGNTEAIKNAVAAGLGISCVSERCIVKELAAGTLEKVELSGIEIKRPFNLIYHQDKCMTERFNTFVEMAWLMVNKHRKKF